MTTPPTLTIKRKDKRQREASFEKLRAEGIRLAQAASGDTWTDYNLHDPGVTILEQLCYALTDLIYRSEFPVADHLTGPDGRIDYERQCLHAPQVILPCRPTTTTDYRRLLLDRVDGIDDARFVVPQRPAGAPPAIAGLHQLVLRLSEQLPQQRGQSAAAAAAPAMRQVLAAYRAHRNLCEDLDASVTLVKDLPCELQAEIEIGGARDPADMLAEIYELCDRHIARPVQLHSAAELLAHGHTLEEIFTGPPMQHGFIDMAEGATASSSSQAPPLLCVGDLTAQVLRVDGVKDVHRLALQCGDQPPASGSVPWRGAGWALRLQVPDDPAHPGRVRLMRRGSQVDVPVREVHARFEDLRAARRARRAGGDDQATAAPLPQGEHRHLERYQSIQHQFPAVYGLGEHGVPAGASAQQKAQVLQLKGYLLLFEQLMAHGSMQLQHVRDLFGLDGTPAQSYWWQMLDTDSVPGIDRLYRVPPDDIAVVLGARFDPYAERKSRVLDHLLALYGETWSQNSMRQFCSYLGPAELEHLLLENKAAFLRDVVALGRDRAAGFDYSRPSWNQPDNCGGLQRRVSLLLGFRHAFSRPLTAAVHVLQRELRPPRPEGATPDDAVPGRIEAPDTGALEAVGTPAHRASRDEMQADLQQLLPLRGRYLAEPVLRAGVQRDRYRTQALPAQAGHRLLLGPDEQGQWWHLADFSSPAAAWRAADSLRRFLLHLNQDSEGLHMVEHVLLRPVGQSTLHAALNLPQEFYGLRFSVVFPAWPVRCHQANFRRLASETVHINAPAHLAGQCLWLGFAAMRHFEATYEEWLQARLAFANEPGSEPAARLNRAACRVIEALLAHGAAAGPAGAANGSGPSAGPPPSRPASPRGIG
jgi:hypothetical protein